MALAMAETGLLASTVHLQAPLREYNLAAFKIMFALLIKVT